MNTWWQSCAFLTQTYFSSLPPSPVTCPQDHSAAPGTLERELQVGPYSSPRESKDVVVRLKERFRYNPAAPGTSSWGRASGNPSAAPSARLVEQIEILVFTPRYSREKITSGKPGDLELKVSNQNILDHWSKEF